MWDGEIHTATVNGGLVNVILGTKAPFGDSSIFGGMLYLDITVDANADGVINESDPPMLPRQRIVPNMYVQDAGKLEGKRWSDFFTVPPGAPGDPDPAKNPVNARARNADLFDDIDSAALFVDPANLTDPKVKRAAVADFATSFSETMNYKVGILTESVIVCQGEGRKDLPGMTVTFTCSGRPVLVKIFARCKEGGFRQLTTMEATGYLYITRDDKDIASLICGYNDECPFNLSCMDFPPPGEHTYKIQMEARGELFDDCMSISTFQNECKIVVLEL